jgi:hypothetical protein
MTKVERVAEGKVCYNYAMCDFTIDELPGLLRIESGTKQVQEKGK